MPTTRERTLIFGAGIGLFLILVLVLLLVSAAQHQIRPADIESFGPNGLKALALLLETTARRPVVSGPDLPDLKTLVVLNSTANLGEPTRETFLGWVNQGGTLIELAQDQPQLNPNAYELLISINPETPVASPDPRLQGLTYRPRKYQLAVASDPQYPLYPIKNGCFAFAQDYGQGRIITWTDPGGLSNRYLKEYPDNAVAFVSLVRSYQPTGPVCFYYPKFETTAPVAQFQYRDLIYRYRIPALLALAGLGLVLWKLMVRFGRPRPLVLATGRSYNEFLLSLAGLFQAANSRSLVLENLWRDLLQTIARITGLSPQTELEFLLERLTVFTGKSFPELPVLAAELNQPRPERYSRDDFIRLAHKIDGYRKELSQWKGSRSLKHG